jgi:hypothetical protein
MTSLQDSEPSEKNKQQKAHAEFKLKKTSQQPNIKRQRMSFYPDRLEHKISMSIKHATVEENDRTVIGRLIR